LTEARVLIITAKALVIQAQFESVKIFIKLLLALVMRAESPDTPAYNSVNSPIEKLIQ